MGMLARELGMAIMRELVGKKLDDDERRWRLRGWRWGLARAIDTWRDS